MHKLYLNPVAVCDPPCKSDQTCQVNSNLGQAYSAECVANPNSVKTCTFDSDGTATCFNEGLLQNPCNSSCATNQICNSGKCMTPSNRKTPIAETPIVQLVDK